MKNRVAIDSNVGCYCDLMAALILVALMLVALMIFAVHYVLAPMRAGQTISAVRYGLVLAARRFCLVPKIVEPQIVQALKFWERWILLVPESCGYSVWLTVNVAVPVQTPADVTLSHAVLAMNEAPFVVS